MNIIDRLEWRYATKKFDPNFTIAPEKIDILKKAFNLTATSYGLQPIKLIVISNKEKRKGLTPLAYNQKQVEEASHLLIICIQKNFDQNDVAQYFDRVKKTRNTEDKILNPFKDFLMQSFSKKSLEEIELASKFQAYIALGNLINVCAIEGIDACPMEGFQPDAFDKTLGLEPLNLKATLLLPIGKRAEDDFMAKEKKVRKI